MRREPREQEGIMHVYLEFANYNPVLFSSIVPKSAHWQISTFENLYAEYQRILNGRILNNLTKNEIKDLVIQLKQRTNAKMIQIASLLHVDYKYVRDL